MSTPTRPTDDIRRRLLAGEPLTTAGVSADYGCSTALLGTVVKTLRGEGVTIAAVRDREVRGMPATFTATDAAVDAAAWGKAKGVRKMTGRGPAKAPKVAAMETRPAAAVAKVPARKRNGIAIPSLPALDSSLRVCLLAVDDDGRVSIGIRSDAGTWLTSVDGFAAAE